MWNYIFCHFKSQLKKKEASLMEIFAYERLPCLAAPSCNHERFSPTCAGHSPDVGLKDFSSCIKCAPCFSEYGKRKVIKSLTVMSNKACQLFVFLVSAQMWCHWKCVLIHHQQHSQRGVEPSCSRATGNLFNTTSLQAELFLALPSVGGGWHDGFLSICTLL